MSTIADFSDRRRLVGFVEHVFVGRVRESAGIHHDVPPVTRELGEPRYTVEVLESIKGALGGEVIVEWPRLELGREYVFTTNPSPRGDWQMGVSQYGATLIDGTHDRAQVIKDFRQAYQHQIPESETLREYQEQLRNNSR
jgi:hypothetical protein